MQKFMLNLEKINTAPMTMKNMKDNFLSLLKKEVRHVQWDHFLGKTPQEKVVSLNKYGIDQFFPTAFRRVNRRSCAELLLSWFERVPELLSDLQLPYHASFISHPNTRDLFVRESKHAESDVRELDPAVIAANLIYRVRYVLYSFAMTTDQRGQGGISLSKLYCISDTFLQRVQLPPLEVIIQNPIARRSLSRGTGFRMLIDALRRRQAGASQGFFGSPPVGGEDAPGLLTQAELPPEQRQRILAQARAGEVAGARRDARRHAMNIHPDKGGDPEAMKALNALMRVLDSDKPEELEKFLKQYQKPRPSAGKPHPGG